MERISTHWDDIVGQPQAVALLQSAMRAPVHAYLFLGPDGVGKREAARVFAAGLLSDGFEAPDTERVLRLAKTEQLADLTVIEPEGRQLLTADARQAIYEAGQPPVEKHRKVVLIDRFHTATPEAAASLLKIVEEPPAATVILILANEVPGEHITIASRCVTVQFSPLSAEDITGWLVAAGLAEATDATGLAEAARGNQKRAKLLASDEGFAVRHDFWQNAPFRCGTTGYEACRLADEIGEMLEAAQGPILAEHEAEVAQEKEMETQFHLRVGDKKAREARHRRELRRFREEEILWGFAVMANAYWEVQRGGAGFVSHGTVSRDTVSPNGDFSAVALIQETQAELVRNPSEKLMLQNLFRQLPNLSA